MKTYADPKHCSVIALINLDPNGTGSIFRLRNTARKETFSSIRAQCGPSPADRCSLRSSPHHPPHHPHCWDCQSGRTDWCPCKPKVNLSKLSSCKEILYQFLRTAKNNDCSVPVLRIRIRIRGIRIISLDPDPYQKMAGSGIWIRIK